VKRDLSARIIAVTTALDKASDALPPQLDGRSLLEARAIIRDYLNHIRDEFAR